VAVVDTPRPRLPAALPNFIALLEQHAPWLLGGFCVVYLVGTCGRASRKLLWHDELFTLYITRLPHLSDVWRAIATGAEASPPLFFAATRASVALFGDGLISVRLPAILGFLIATLAVYAFVRRRYGALYGMAACVVPAATHAYVYAYEARPYGMVLGLVGIALVAWQRAAEGGRRAWWLALLCSSLAAALLSHYYAVLLLAPLGLGEVARLWRRQTPDWMMWGVLVAPLGALALVLPLIQSAVAGASGFYSAVRADVVIDGYEAVLVSLSLPSIVILTAIAAAATVGRGRLTADDRISTPSAPLHEWVAAVALMLLPVWGAFAARLVVGAFVFRYATSWILGFSILVAFAAATMSSHARLVGAIALVTLLGWASLKIAPSARFLALEGPTIADTNAVLLADRGGVLPIVVTHAHIFLPLVEYAPREIAARLVILAGPPRVADRWGAETAERSLRALSTIFPIHVDEFDSFLAGHRRFLLYGPPMWVTEELRAAGARLLLKGEEHEIAPFNMSDPGTNFLYEVRLD
jgi:hypothetical protein